MGVHNSCELDGTIVDGLLQDWSDPSYGNCLLTDLLPTPNVEYAHILVLKLERCETHSSGFAGSMMTASLDLSSTTR